MWWLLGVCISCLFFCTGVLGTFVPLQNPNGVEYLFVAPTAATLWPAWLLCVVVLVTAFFAVRARARAGSPQQLAEANSGRWLAPLAAVGVVALGILPAVPGVGEHGSVVGYFLYDLRWWWVIVLAALALARADGLLGAPFRGVARWVAGWSSAARLLLLDTLLFVGVVTWAVKTTPHGLENFLAGDEPKYLRYCEVWYQGQGLDISSLVLVRDQPLDARPALLQNGAGLIHAIPQDIRAFATDLRNFAREPSGFRWNRASAYNAFVSGIHGGLYQEHSAGMSVLLFPGYFVDRYLLNVDSSGDGKWPRDFTATNLMMLLTYGVCSVMLFRLLRHALGSDVLAWIWTAAAMLTLPTTAFAFQLYPELPALLIILAVSDELLFADRSRWLAAAMAGAGTGALAWFHVRFLLISLCLAAVAFVMKTGRARWAFQATFGLLVFSVMMFNYHVTGSWWPTALWDANGQGVIFNNTGFVLNLIGYALDRRFGLLPYSLLLLGTLPGLFVLGRESRRHAAFVAVVVLALVAPSAGHTLSGANTTPDRLVVAVAPLLMWPVAVLVRRFWFSRAVRIVTVALGVISLDTGRAYNWKHEKYFGLLRDVSISGWKPNLAFPDMRGEIWDASRANFVLFVGVALFMLGLSWLAIDRARDAAIRPPSRTLTPGKPDPTQKPGPTQNLDPIKARAHLRGPALAGLVVAGLIGLFSAATSANDDWAHPRFLLDDVIARSAAVRAVLRSDRCVCFTSAQGHIDWTGLGPNSAGSALVDMSSDGLHLTVRIFVPGDGKAPAFGRLRVEFGDGEESAWMGVLAEDRIAHTYRQPGTYPVKVWFQVPAYVSVQLHQQTVEVHAAS
jgi:hypothetical protein